MQLLISPGGNIRSIYAEVIDLAEIGRVSISRGSYVEPDEAGRWFADLAPVGGPRRGPFSRRSDALQAEAEWLQDNWLLPSLD